MEIFGNPIPGRHEHRARRKRDRFARRFGFDPQARFTVRSQPEPALASLLPLETLVPDQSASPVDSKNAIIVGTIRMGYGHYRIGLALASAALSMGLRPHWFDLLAFPATPGARIISHLESLYNFGSHLSRQFPLFNRLYWEPLTSKTFRTLSYNAVDREMCSLMAPMFRDLDPAIPVLATHTWPAQAAIHAGVRRVVNAIPDNLALAIHLAEGAHHTVQSPSTYFGYRTLHNMGKFGEALRPMPADALSLAGHYVDHELVANLESDTAARFDRLERNLPLRLLISIGGAGVQCRFAAALIRHLAAPLREGAVALFINLGDHSDFLAMLQPAIDDSCVSAVRHETWEDTITFASALLTAPAAGLHLFLHSSLFSAVYTTNLLMRGVDVLLTKPSELAFYPIPKLFFPRVGGHEAWGAIRAAELGDGTLECESIDQVLQAVDLFREDSDLLHRQCDAILTQHRAGTYRGAYHVVECAAAAANL